MSRLSVHACQRVIQAASPQELMGFGGWKSAWYTLQNPDLAPEHLADAADRIEIPLESVANKTTTSLPWKCKWHSKV